MNILHLEFSAFFKRFLKDVLTTNGHHYLSSSSGNECFKLLSLHEVDVILTGMELEDMSAHDLIKELNHSRYQNIPIVIITSSDVENLTQKLKGLQFKDYIIKEQLTIENLLQTLDRIEDELEVAL